MTRAKAINATGVVVGPPVVASREDLRHRTNEIASSEPRSIPALWLFSQAPSKYHSTSLHQVLAAGCDPALANFWSGSTTLEKALQ
jgi:hypothetical protein